MTNMIKNNKLLAISINVFFVILFAIFGIVRYGSLDDYFMSTVMTGAYGSEFDPHLVFINAVIAYLLKPLYWLFPKVGWLYIFEGSSIFASFSIICYFFIKQLKRKFGIPFAFLIASFSLNFYNEISFTQCAALLVTTGSLLFLFGTREQRTFSLTIGVLFLFIGASLRWQMFLLGIPFMLLPLVLLQNPLRSWRITAFVAVALCSVAIFASQKFDDSLYNTKEYQHYKAYQGTRSLFGDGGHYEKDAVYDELEERGLQGRDFQLLCGWNFYDTQVFSLDSLVPIVQVVKRNAYMINKVRLPAAIALAISNSFTRNEAWFWCIVSIFILMFSKKRSRLYPWVSLAIVVSAYTYLFMLNRIAGHVEMGIWLYASMMGIPLLQEPPKKAIENLGKKLNSLPPLIFLIAVCFAFIAILNLPKLERNNHLLTIPEMSESWRMFVEYAEQHPDDIFLLSFYNYKELGMVKDPAYRAASPGSWKNIIPIGYWNVYLPGMKRELKYRGVENPLRDIVNDNVFLIESGNLPQFQLYYQTHYHKNLKVDTAKTLGNIMLLKYSEAK